MQRIVIADLKSYNNGGVCAGHFYAFASNYQQIFSKSCEVKIAGGPIYRKRFSDAELMPLPCDISEGQSKLKSFFRMIRNAKSLMRQTTPSDIIIIQQSKPAQILFSLIFTCWEKRNIYHVEYSEEPMMRPYYRMAMRLRGKKILKGTLCPNDIVGRAYEMPYLVLPDYIYVSSNNNVTGNYHEKCYDFCTLGRIVYEKGISGAALALRGKPYSYLISGYAEESSEVNIIRQAAEGCTNLTVQLDYLTDEQYDKLLNSSRYAILNYIGAYTEKSSGVVLDMLFHGVPIIGHRCRALQFVEDEHVGVLYDDINTFDFASVLNEETYQACLVGIKNYLRRFSNDIEHLYHFLGIERIIV